MIDDFKSSKNSHITQINDKKVILNTQSGKYFMLNNIGTQIWGYVESNDNMSIERLSHQLAKNYNEREDIIFKEIKNFIETASNFGLLSK